MSSWTPNHKYWKPGSAGHRINGVGFDIVDPDEKGHGEIAMVGRHVFMGYLGEENKTKETFDSEFRLRSGDVGFVDPDGFLFISGRIKGKQNSSCETKHQSDETLCCSGLILTDFDKLIN